MFLTVGLLTDVWTKYELFHFFILHQESLPGNKLLVIYNKAILTSNCAVYKRFKLLTAVINNKFNKTSSNFML